MEDTLQHKETTQCIGLSPASSWSHFGSGSEANHALTINLDQSDEAAQLDHGEYFEQWDYRFNELLETRLVDLEDLQDFLVWLEYVKPDDEDDLYSFEELKSKIEMKIEGIEKREVWRESNHFRSLKHDGVAYNRDRNLITHF